MFVTLTDTAHFLVWHQLQQIKQKTKIDKQTKTYYIKQIKTTQHFADRIVDVVAVGEKSTNVGC
jgi:hypothetical protein